MAIATKDELSQRVAKEKEVSLSAPPQVDIERTKFQLESFAETEGQPEVIRRAKFFHKLCCEKGIFIDDNPIIGTLTRFKYGGYIFPEFGAGWLKNAERISLPRGEAAITDEVREWKDKAFDYWKDKSVFSLTRDIILESHNLDIRVFAKCGVATELTPAGFIGTTPDYYCVLDAGLRGIIDEINKEKAKLDIGFCENLAKWHFYQATLLCLDGVIQLANRYAALAREMASKEEDAIRKQELEQIAEICQRVPEHPPRDFREALQSFWFTQLGLWMESPVVGTSPPVLFTKCLYPFYKQDKEEGKITDEEVIDLVHFYFLKINHQAMALAPHGFAYSQSRLMQQLSIGGVTPEGEDATNELDWLVLEAQRRIKLPEPLVNLIYHNNLSEEFLLKCVELIMTGIGQPAFHDSEKSIKRALLYEEASLEEARNIGIVGCVQSIIPGYSDFFWEGWLNIAKMLELALNDGKDPLTVIQLGPHTGDAEEFHAYYQLYEAFLHQLLHFVPLVRTISRVAWNVERNFPVPLASALTNDCIERGKDLIDGGARYTVGDGFCAVGTIDAANSLAAVKTLVYENQRLTMQQLLKALEVDFDGCEDTHRMCLDAPKYGNDDDSVDSIARGIYNIFAMEHQQFTDFLGRRIKPEAYSATAHFATGRFTGALPNGRKARQALTDASVSAQPGTDKSGPTSLIKSAAKVLDTTKFGTNHFNMKFHPLAFKDMEGRRKFLSLIKTYFDLGGYHVQFNCVSSDVLRDAQLHPEKYRNLVVRVAGFSAFFTNLDPAVQDEIIKRTELQL